ncbi:MAG: hypothetical protein V3S55_15280 [Nitrospiraceae bacterium]
MSHAITADFFTPPYLHQLREFEDHCETQSRALLWQMRTGKTKLIVDMACHLFKAGLIDAVLLFAPNGVHENWTRRELPKHHWLTVPRDTIVWRTDIAGERGISRVAADERKGWQEQHDAWWERSKRLLATDRLAWFAFASETMTREDCRRIIAKIVKKRRLLVVFDESHDFRSAGSKRTHMARALAKRCLFKRLLTASVITNTPLAAFAQYELLEPGALGFRTAEQFKDHHATYKMETTRKGRKYPVLDEYINLDELRDRMAPWSSVVLRDDCGDLPDLVRVPRHIEPSDEQLRVYRELHREFEVELSDGRVVSIGENTSRMTKLQQVMSGFLVDEFKDLYWLPGPNPRLEALSDEVYLSPGKVVVWCRFRPDMDIVAARLRADGHKVLEYHGRTSDEDKAHVRDIMASDSAENDVKAIVGYPTLGIDLSAAAEIVWYSHTFDAIKREQADERATVMGGGNTRVTDLIMPGPDEYILENVTNKINVADAVAGTGLREVLRRIQL